MDFDGVEVIQFPLRPSEDIWGQWNQCNDLSLGTNYPLADGRRQHNNDGDTAFTEVFDADFKYLYKVPSHLVVHTPSARLNITRLVFCRNYRSHEPGSCKMGDGCKFVHADVDIWTLRAFSIHVNYIWSHEDLCTYDRLLPGELVEVLSSDASTVKLIPSERIIITCGALARHETAEPLIRCKYFELNQTCFAGDRCNYIHVMCVDPNVRKVFKRVSRTHVETNNIGTSTSFQSSHLGKDYANKSGTNNNVMEGFHGLRATASCWKPNEKVFCNESTDSDFIDIVNKINNATPFIPSQNNFSSSAGVTEGLMTTTKPTSSVNASGEALTQQLSSVFGSPDNSGGLPNGILKMFQNETNSFASSNLCLQGTQAKDGVDKQNLTKSNENGLNTTALTPEQLNAVISQVVSAFANQVSLPRVVTVGKSPLLDDPNSIGTLLFLPHGATEATALQPVYDNWYLGLIAAMGLQQKHSATASAQPKSI